MLYEPANDNINRDKRAKMGSLIKEGASELGLADQISEKTSGFIQSSNHRDLLDVVDALRSNGVSH
jgi:hypothetical protein